MSSIASSTATAAWIRPLAMFLSPVDREKYPDAQQDERFALQEIQSVNHK